MITIRCTQKLLKELHLSRAQLAEPDDGVLGSWFASLFRLERRKCVLFTNDRTLYSFLLFGLLKHDFENLSRRLVKGLTTNLRRDGIPVEMVASIGIACHPVAWGATNNRSVLGSANDMIQQCKFVFSNRHEDPVQIIEWLNVHLNRTPMKAIGYDYAVDKLREALRSEEWKNGPH